MIHYTTVLQSCSEYLVRQLPHSPDSLLLHRPSFINLVRVLPGRLCLVIEESQVVVIDVGASVPHRLEQERPRQPALHDRSVGCPQRLNVQLLALGLDLRPLEHLLDCQNETIAEIFDRLEGLRPAELQQTYEMTKLAEAMCLSDDPRATRNHNLLSGRDN